MLRRGARTRCETAADLVAICNKGVRKATTLFISGSCLVYEFEIEIYGFEAQSTMRPDDRQQKVSCVQIASFDMN